jgi:hypothetical protein
MTTAITAKSMVRKARTNTDRISDSLEFLVLMTLPFFLPFGIMFLTTL